MSHSRPLTPAPPAAVTAHEQHERIVALAQLVNAAMIEMAAALWQFHQGEGWLAQVRLKRWMPQRQPALALGRRSVFRLIRIYDVYVQRLSCDTEALLAAGVSKLDRMAPYVHAGNVEAWLLKARTLSRADLLDELLLLPAGPQPGDNGRPKPITNESEYRQVKVEAEMLPHGPERDTLRALARTWEAAGQGARLPEVVRDVVTCPHCGERIEL